MDSASLHSFHESIQEPQQTVFFTVYPHRATWANRNPQLGVKRQDQITTEQVLQISVTLHVQPTGLSQINN